MQRDIDITIYGASGFTGRLAALALTQEPQLKVALGGRDRGKLEAVASLCAHKPEIIVAEAHDKTAIEGLVRRSKVVANFAGPFARYAETLIAACVEQGKAYCDITGETVFVADMITRYEARARQTGAVLIPMSGFDSVPADLTSYLAFDLARKMGWRPDRMDHYYRIRGGFNGGTIETAFSMNSERDRERFQKENSLITDPRWPDVESLISRPVYDDILKQWSAPFFMHFTNAPVVRRGRFLAGDKRFAQTRYSERILTGRGTKGRLAAHVVTAGLATFFTLMNQKAGRSLLRLVTPKPGEGPSEEARESGYYSGTLVLREKGQGLGQVTMKAKGDPGNVVTVLCALEIAKMLAEGNVNARGFTVPSLAFGERIIQRLQKRGVAFAVETFA